MSGHDEELKATSAVMLLELTAEPAARELVLRLGAEGHTLGLLCGGEGIDVLDLQLEAERAGGITVAFEQLDPATAIERMIDFFGRLDEIICRTPELAATFEAELAKRPAGRRPRLTRHGAGE